ncbi:HemK methyltransferase member 1 [Saguinus oedipus]|uniref:HemK methyltransferase member 1 n=1 Tax=Saguinus oedipus TaxID=9490 RepID=A0ABQ9U2F2_SAGOE|nr:HemK methyltransferase member 1 [Saguinus oedipus]
MSSCCLGRYSAVRHLPLHPCLWTRACVPQPSSGTNSDPDPSASQELVEWVLEEVAQRSHAVGSPGSPLILEVGCGSGAISLSLLSQLPQSRVIAVDKGEAAISLTHENAQRLQLQDRIWIIHLDMTSEGSWTHLPWGPVDLVVSNPPYVFHQDMEQLAPEIRRQVLNRIETKKRSSLWEGTHALTANGTQQAHLALPGRVLPMGDLPFSPEYKFHGAPFMETLPTPSMHFEYPSLRMSHPTAFPFSYEDPAALDGGEEGMDIITHILALAPWLLKDCGYEWDGLLGLPPAAASAPSVYWAGPSRSEHRTLTSPAQVAQNGRSQPCPAEPIYFSPMQEYLLGSGPEAPGTCQQLASEPA